jgi:hypothetical protein
VWYLVWLVWTYFYSIDYIQFGLNVSSNNLWSSHLNKIWYFFYYRRIHSYIQLYKHFSDLMKLLVALFSKFVKSLNISVNSWIPQVKQWLRELTEHFRGFMKSLVSRIYISGISWNPWFHEFTVTYTQCIRMIWDCKLLDLLHLVKKCNFSGSNPNKKKKKKRRLDPCCTRTCDIHILISGTLTF